ncbi:MAG: TetR/AcrR family transcriptional regulator [Lachnospiraceae bacterium]|nr:TetR/AcrR family transcriptional regulator [Lachnospiraceae bacterium]MBR5896959.1 TetR/AcrR family transcriptional regulator [Lachnospiraceae bacterium]
MRNLEKDEKEMAQKRERMLAEGYRLFAERGIEAVSMTDIASASEVGIATLYRYYNTKLSLVLAIGARKWEEFGERIMVLRKENNADNMTAKEELEFYFDLYIKLYRNHKDLLCFNQNFNNYVRHEGASAEQLEGYISAIKGLGKLFSLLYEKGKRDGTIRTDQSEEIMFASTSHIMLAVTVRYAQGLLFSAGQEEDRTEEILMLKRLLLKEYVTDVIPG